MKYTPVDRPRSKPGAQSFTRAKSGKVMTRKAVPPGEIRIIGGLYKRTKLPVPDKPGLRPTPDRVRETLFNWLGQDLTGWRCLDAFAGTGALGFEAASRGASEVLLCEQDAGLVSQLKVMQAKLKASMVRLERGDGLNLLQRQPAGSWHLVLLDPPFEARLCEPALKAAAHAIGAAGLIYLEAPQAWTDEDLQPLGLRLHRSGKAGAVHFHLLVLCEAPNPPVLASP